MSRTFKTYKGKRIQERANKNRKASRSCLNHGGCPYCLSNKMHKNNKRYINISDEIADMMDNRLCSEPEDVSENLDSMAFFH